VPYKDPARGRRVVEKGAELSADGYYRYRLDRCWDADLPTATWIMLNPSTADHQDDDATIRKCLGFARRLGCGSIEVVNLFALRTRHPSVLRKELYAIGEYNDDHVDAAVAAATGPVIAAWGAHGRWIGGRVQAVLRLPAVQERDLQCLGISKAGDPLHPLMLTYKRPLIPWRLAAPKQQTGTVR